MSQAVAYRWRCTFVAALGVLTTVAIADETPSAAESEDCSGFVAMKATVREIASNPAKYKGRCVHVLGVMQGLDLFQDVDGVYLESKDTFDPSSNGARIGLDNLDGHYSEKYQHVAIVGRVQDCEEVRACVHASAGPDEIVMVSGYCHTANGAYLWIKELRRRKGLPFERQMGGAARPGYGDLAPVPADWEHRAQVEALAGELLAAVQTNDRERLVALHFRNVGLEWEDDEAELVHFILKDRRSPFREFRSRREHPQIQILATRAALEPDDERGSSNYESTVCFCREADCSGRWPIATFDADNLRTRPYACTTVSPYRVPGTGTVPHFSTTLEKIGLAEPKAR